MKWTGEKLLTHRLKNKISSPKNDILVKFLCVERTYSLHKQQKHLCYKTRVKGKFTI